MNSTSCLLHQQHSQRQPSSQISRSQTNEEISESDFRSNNPRRGGMTSMLGTFRGTYVVCLCSIGSFLFAYDTGIVGGVLTLPSFQRDFRYTKAQKTQVNSNCVSILQGGAFFGCFLIWPVTSWLGRKWGIVISSIVFCVGAILQVVNIHSIGLFYAGRVICKSPLVHPACPR